MQLNVLLADVSVSSVLDTIECCVREARPTKQKDASSFLFLEKELSDAEAYCKRWLMLYFMLRDLSIFYSSGQFFSISSEDGYEQRSLLFCSGGMQTGT